MRPVPSRAPLHQYTDVGRDGGLVNPLYLAGAFGVSLDPLALVERSGTGAFSVAGLRLMRDLLEAVRGRGDVHLERLVDEYLDRTPINRAMQYVGFPCNLTLRRSPDEARALHRSSILVRTKGRVRAAAKIGLKYEYRFTGYGDMGRFLAAAAEGAA